MINIPAQSIHPTLVLTDLDKALEAQRLTELCYKTHLALGCECWRKAGFVVGPQTLLSVAQEGWRILRALIDPKVLVKWHRYDGLQSAILLSLTPLDDNAPSILELRLRIHVLDELISHRVAAFDLSFEIEGEWVSGADVLKRYGTFEEV